MDKQRIIYLFNAYQQQTATPEESAEFTKILHDHRYEVILNELLDQIWDKLGANEVEAVEVSGYDRILGEIRQQPQVNKRRRERWTQLAIAASLLIFVATGLYFYKANQVSNSDPLFAKHDILPGKDGATLTLADGKKIHINEIKVGQIVNQQGVKITKTKDGHLVYELANQDGPVGINTLTTSRAEQTQVRLQDGTMVFLNAESSLRYPTSFAKAAKRQISLTGEAYFEVAKDKQHPFEVNTAQQTVEVLGTTFNISSYPDEPTVKTTLLEGTVRIANNNSKATDILKPGEQAAVTSQSLAIKKVETEDEVSWKSGYFMFNNETLEQLMKKVARWYDVDVRYENEALKRKTFFGSVSRFGNVSEVLKLLQKTGGTAFEIKGRQIIVSQQKK